MITSVDSVLLVGWLSVGSGSPQAVKLKHNTIVNNKMTNFFISVPLFSSNTNSIANPLTKCKFTTKMPDHLAGHLL